MLRDKKKAELWGARARVTMEIVEAVVAIHQLEASPGLRFLPKRVTLDTPAMEKLCRAVAKYVALTETEEAELLSPRPDDLPEFEAWCQECNLNGDVKQLFLHWLYKVKERQDDEIVFKRSTYQQLYPLFAQEVAKAASEALYRFGVTFDVVKSFF